MADELPVIEKPDSLMEEVLEINKSLNLTE